MNDARLEELARLAVELEEFERDVIAGASPDDQPHATLRLTDAQTRTHAPHAHALAHAARRHRLVRAAATGLGLAACIGVVLTGAVMTVVPVPPSGLGAQSGSGGHGAQLADSSRIGVQKFGVPEIGVPEHASINSPFTPTLPRIPVGNAARSTRLPDAQAVPGVTNASLRAATAPSEQCCVVIAMARDASGVLRCVDWRQHEWDVQRVSRMSARDLQAATTKPCGPTPPQLVLVAISGPTSSLPRTDESAARLANCILNSPRGCESEGMCFNGAAAGCLPSDVSVKVETIGSW